MWKKLDEPFSRYSASDKGQIRNDKTGYLFKLNPSKDQGYIFIGLMSDKGKHIRTQAHRIIAKTFLDGYREGNVVNHKDFNRANNSVSNLEWVSRKENIEHARDCNRLNLDVGKRRRIAQYDLNGYFVACWSSISEVRLDYDLPTNFASNIGAACRGKNKTAYGYKWEYIDDKPFPVEVWKDIEWNGNNIGVSHLGRIRLIGGKITTGSLSNGYKVVVIKKKIVKVHRLVAAAFLSDFCDHLVVNHKNFFKDDNCVENLEMVTHRENAKHASVKHCKKVCAIDPKTNEIVGVYSSIKEAALAVGRSPSPIGYALRGKQKTSAGYIWAYVDK